MPLTRISLGTHSACPHLTGTPSTNSAASRRTRTLAPRRGVVPHVRPRSLMLYHLGQPAPVHFGEPFLRNVTHLYTSTLCGFRGTLPASLPSLTHIALTTRATQPPLPSTKCSPPQGVCLVPVHISPCSFSPSTPRAAHPVLLSLLPLLPPRSLPMLLAHMQSAKLLHTPSSHFQTSQENCLAIQLKRHARHCCAHRCP
jgi:hypothetical protein